MFVFVYIYVRSELCIVGASSKLSAVHDLTNRNGGDPCGFPILLLAGVFLGPRGIPYLVMSNLLMLAEHLLACNFSHIVRKFSIWPDEAHDWAVLEAPLVGDNTWPRHATI